jgi:hypothetical protein
MAAPRVAGERLSVLRGEIARDAAEVRRRWRDMRDRLPGEWREMRDVGRQVLDLFGVLLRRRAANDSTPPPSSPSPR